MNTLGIDNENDNVNCDIHTPVSSASVASDSPTSLLCRPTDRSPNIANGQAEQSPNRDTRIVARMTAPTTQDCRSAAEIARQSDNKAQHSPIVDVESVLNVATALQKVAELPSESNRDKLTATLTESRQKLLELRERDAREYATLKAHADKLAEALREIIANTKPAHDFEGIIKPPTRKQLDSAREALAAYEKDSQ